MILLLHGIKRISVFTIAFAISIIQSYGQAEVKYVNHKIQNWMFCITDTLSYKLYQFQNDELYEMTYSSNSNCYKYILSSKDTNKLSIIVNGNFEDLRIVDQEFFVINDKEYSVYKLLSGESLIDGEELHFWSPPLGIVIIRAGPWGHFKTLLVNDPIVQNEIDVLIRMILIHPTFYYGHEHIHQ